MQRLKCDVNKTMHQIAATIVLRRAFGSRTKNLYETLGLDRSATQGDIKNAYYKLSMVYHPDKNKENETAAEKFREITSAYEVLGNFRLRKLYDKGMIHTAGDRYQSQAPSPEEEEKDPTTRFYKARMKKEHTTATGRTPIYDFDSWTNLHYGGEFKRQQKLRYSSEVKKAAKIQSMKDFHNESLLVLIVIFVVFFTLMQKKNHDVDTRKSKKSPEDST